jgi:hypothetical protein
MEPVTQPRHLSVRALATICAGAVALAACGSSPSSGAKPTTTSKLTSSPANNASPPASTPPPNGVAGAQALQQGFVSVAGRVLPRWWRS